MIKLAKKRITVTGGKGFLGNHLVRKLQKERGCINVSMADLPEYDLRDLVSIQKMLGDQKPDIVIHLAAVVGGIGTIKENPGKFFYDNAIRGIQLLYEALLKCVEKFVLIGTICTYPIFAPIPFKE